MSALVMLYKDALKEIAFTTVANQCQESTTFPALPDSMAWHEDNSMIRSHPMQRYQNLTSQTSCAFHAVSDSNCTVLRKSLKAHKRGYPLKNYK
eukprot:5536199-Amphidinium_carterae.1